MRAILIAALAVASVPTFGFLRAESSGGGAQTAPSINQQFAGTYKLVTTERRDQSGQLVSEPGGSPGRYGLLMYDPGGYMAVAIMAEGRPKFAGPQPTPQEAQAAMAGYTSYFGTFAVDEAKRIVTHKTLGSISPANLGMDLPRAYTMTGNRLILKPPPGSTGVQNSLVWERIPDLKTMTPTHRQFIGFWKLVLRDRRNAKGEVLSSSPGEVGYIIYTSSGHMMAQIMPPDRKKSAGAQPTPEEVLAGYRGYTSYFGPYTVNEPERTVIHHRLGVSDPSQVGIDAPRVYDFSGRQLILKPPMSKEEVQSVITWERLSTDPGRTQ